MAKGKPVEHKKVPDRLVKVTWPILEHSKRDLRGNILRVLDLIRSQLDNDSIFIFMIMIGRAELDSLIINYGVHMATLHYFNDIERDSMQIIFQVPSTEQAISKKKL